MCFVNCIYSVGDFQVKTLQTQIDRASHFRFFVFLYFWEDYFHKKAATWEIGAFGARQVTCQTILSFEKDIGGSATIIWTNVSFQMNYFVKCEDVHCWWEFALWSLTSFGGIFNFAFYTLIVKLKGKALMLEVANMQRWMLSLLIYWRCVTFSLSLLQNLKTFSSEMSMSLNSESLVNWW